MAYYHQYSPMYAYHYMPYANQDLESGPMGFDPNFHPRGPAYPHPMMTGSPPRAHIGGHHKMHYVKPGYNNRKISSDSGISDHSSRKFSSTSTISNASMILEESSLEDLKEETPFVEPDEELCEKLVQQVEFYFSDANVTKDKFLLKHIKRNKEGFVSLKLISSFKRVKHLTKDWRQVAHAVQNKSKLLEINGEKTKVRRLQPLPEYDETTPSRTVVALNLPMERPTIEAVAELFAKCGDIVLVRILRPGNPVPADIKPFVNKHPEMTDKVCALIEFELTEYALKAVSDLNDDNEDKMTVMELTTPVVKPPRKDSKKMSGSHKAPARRFSHASLTPSQQHQDVVLAPNAPRRRISLHHSMKFAPIAEKPEHFTLNPDAPTFQLHSRPTMPSYMSPQHFGPPVDMRHMPWMMQRLSLAHPEQVAKNNEKSKGFQKWCKNRMDTDVKPASKAVPIVAPAEIEAEVKVEEVKVKERSDGEFALKADEVIDEKSR